ncbi:MAG: amidohydrolase [Candidatus Aminicenantes bacterium]|nr:amidohydrolase [Candidatus Aminicenantes bacterium]
MKKRVFRKSFILLLFIMGTVLSGFSVDKKTAFRIERAISENLQEIIRLRRFIHMNPELSNREFQTARAVAAKLMSLELEVKTGVAKTGVVALLRGEQPGFTVAIRADMDALPIQEMTSVPFKSLNPGVMHACGHDVHTAIGVGTAVVLNTLKDRIHGSVKFIFQPAEEGAPFGEEGGADLMIKEGVLENPSVGAIFGLHVWPQPLGNVYFSPGSIMASSDWFRVAIKGKSAHGARPHEGKDAIAIAAQTIVSLQSIISRSINPTDPAVLTIGKIYGGTKSNIIADEVTFEGTVRTFNEITRNRIRTMMEDIIRGTTQSFRMNYTFEYTMGSPSVYNHPELAKIMSPTLEKLLGRQHVKSLAPQMVAEDFAYYCRKIPGFFLLLGVKSPQIDRMAPLHSPYFIPDESCIPLGIKVMCHLILDCLEKQKLLEENPF